MVKPMEKQAMNGKTLNAYTKNGYVRAHETKEEGTRKIGLALWQSTDPRRKRQKSMGPWDM